jgi:aminoglycoside phosphotransferase (APT) family kinase protein
MATDPIDVRASPNDDFIAEMRRRFPVEPEIDRVLTVKLRQRAGSGFSAIPLDRLAESTVSLIRSQIGTDCLLSEPRWLGGGASKLQMAFELEWNGLENGERRKTPMVLRMEPPASIVETSRLREFEMLRLMRGVVPVPPCYWVDFRAQHLPYPGLVYGFVDGRTKPSARPSQQVTGIGTNFGPELRPVLARQFVDHLAAIHAAPPERLAALTAFEPAQVGSSASIVRQVNWWRRVWEEDRPEAVPLVEVAARWLIANAPPLDHVSPVHGDFRAGNFLYSEGTQKIIAWLDWELAVLGDRHQDLAWTTGVHFGHLAEDGRTFLASGLMATDELFAKYEAASCLRIDPKRIKYFRVFNDFSSTVHMLATAWRVARHSKTHQDVVVAWLAMIGNVIVGGLRDTLEELI